MQRNLRQESLQTTGATKTLTTQISHTNKEVRAPLHRAHKVFSFMLVSACKYEVREKLCFFTSAVYTHTEDPQACGILCVSI